MDKYYTYFLEVSSALYDEDERADDLLSLTCPYIFYISLTGNHGIDAIVNEVQNEEEEYGVFNLNRGG